MRSRAASSAAPPSCSPSSRSPSAARSPSPAIPTPARRRSQSVFESQMAQPERLGLWAFLLGLFLMVVAAGTAHA